MLALSIRQPWAWAIIHADKDIENRAWPTRVRGPILIHAAKGMTRTEYEDAVEFMRVTCDVKCPHAIELDRGGIIGEAEIVNCVTQSDSLWFFGDYGFVLRNARPLPFKPCNGRLGFWEV